MLKRERVFNLSVSEGARRVPTHGAALRVEWATPLTVGKPRWRSVVLDALAEARELLDRLENTGRTIRELRILDDAGFEVCWRDYYSTATNGAR